MIRRGVLFSLPFLAFFLLSSPAGVARAQATGSAADTQALWELARGQEPLKAIEILRQKAGEGDAIAPFLNAAYLRVGRWDLRQGGVFFFDTAKACRSVRDEAAGTGAVDWLESRLDGVRVLIFNENHGDPGPRWFLGELLPLLHEHGFRQLGLEALDVDHPLDPSNSALAVEHGAAVSEPVFAGLIRKAIRIGFSVFGYDRFETAGWRDKDTFDRILTREAGQAAILAERAASIPQGEKIVVLGGLTHITRDWQRLDDGRRLGWMAAQFEERTGIEPLSIDLVSCPVETGARARLEDAHLYVSESGEPVMAGPYAGRVDAQFHIPAGGTSPGTFRHAMGRAWHLPASAVPREGIILLEAFAEGEPAEALPYDRLMLEPGEDFPLFLPPGRYAVRATDPAGEGLAEIDARVDP